MEALKKKYFFPNSEVNTCGLTLQKYTYCIAASLRVKQFQRVHVFVGSVSKVMYQKFLGVSKAMCQMFYSLLGVS